ncbi:hypothetical protein GCM10020218_093130 [Dactylosporangium vinaceum]
MYVVKGPDREVRRGRLVAHGNQPHRDERRRRQNTQPGALFLAQTYSNMLENGVSPSDRWDVHNGIGTVSTIGRPRRDYGDFGMLSSGHCTSDGTGLPAADEHTPVRAVHTRSSSCNPPSCTPGDQLIGGHRQPLVAAHARAGPTGIDGAVRHNMEPGASQRGEDRL